MLSRTKGSETLTHKGQWPLPSKALHVWGLVCLEALKKALSCAWLRARPDSRVAMQVPMMMISPPPAAEKGFGAEKGFSSGCLWRCGSDADRERWGADQ